MAEQIVIPATTDRAERYRALMPQMGALLAGESDPIAAMANFSAALQQMFQWHWTGFYRVAGEVLLLGPFQGPVACTRIKMGRGVCGVAWQNKATLIVPDVEKFPGHIACSSLSQSEIVVAVFKNNQVVAVLDADSATLNSFDETDKKFLEEMVGLLGF